MSNSKQTRFIEVEGTLPQSCQSVPGRGQYCEQSRLDRLNFLEKHSGSEVKWLSNSRLPSEFVQGNIENYIGTIEIPVGIAGPLIVNGSTGTSVVYPPLATTEGALVASVARGSRALTESGGCSAHIVSQCMVRAPVFKFSSISHAILFSRFIQDRIEELREKVESASKHAQLRDIETEVIGRIVHVRFIYETADAAGQNMTTKCTAKGCTWLTRVAENVLGIRALHSQIEGNTSGDKKVNSASYQRGRGVKVAAECEISEETLLRVLNVSADKFIEGYQLGVSGGIASGMIGYNINVANVIAAMFTATGQDIASVHESSIGHFHVERTANGLYTSMTLSTLIVGTIGGGTALPGQKEMLESLGCYGEGGRNLLAEIICSTCLALDISTMAAVAAGDFADAHERLGRRSSVVAQ